MIDLKHTLGGAIAATAALSMTIPALAQAPDSGPPAGMPKPPAGDRFTIGIGGGIGPDHEGSNETDFQPGGVMQGRISGFDVQVRGTNIYVDLIRDQPGSDTNLTFGPVAQVRLDRTGTIRDARVAALGDRKTAVELGGYVGVGKRGVLIPPDSVNVELSFVHDVAGAHGSYILSPSVSYSTPLSRQNYARLVLSADYVGEGFGRTYFDVTPAGAAASGLKAYGVQGGGFKSAGSVLLLVHDLGGDPFTGVGLFALGGYKRLLGKYAASPVVRDAGSASQGFGVAGVTYSF